jgi:hypothetical protein
VQCLPPLIACRINLKYHTNPDKFGDQTTSFWLEGSGLWAYGCSVAKRGMDQWASVLTHPQPPKVETARHQPFLAPKSMLVRCLLYGKKKARVSAMCYTIYIYNIFITLYNYCNPSFYSSWLIFLLNLHRVSVRSSEFLRWNALGFPLAPAMTGNG